MNHRPTPGDAGSLARRLFGVDGEATPLPGEFDWNYRVSGPAGDFVLKLGSPGRRPVFELITAALTHLEGSGPGGRVQRVVRASGGTPPSAIAEIDVRGETLIASACTYVAGIPLAALRPRSMAVLESLGALLAELDAALADFEHPALARDFPWRMDTAPATARARLGDLAGGRDLIAATLDRALRRLDPVRGDLPRSVIHNDANDYNVIVIPSLEGARLSGLIDFGDVVRGWRAAEIAIAATYAMMGLPDPLEAACAIVRGYASVSPPSGAECAAIVPMVALRLCISVCVQAGEMRRQPDNVYLAVSQEPAWELLRTLARTDWRIAEFRIREAAGLPPNPGLAAVAGRTAAAPVMEQSPRG